MLKQMFTAENFRRIFDRENRKGHDVAGRFFAQLVPQTIAIQDKARELREFRKKRIGMQPEEFKKQIAVLRAERAKLKANKSADVDKLMEQVSLNVMEPGFKIALEQKDGPKGKPVYCIDASPEAYFVVKQLQKNLNEIYGVQQSNRHDLVCRIRDTIHGRFPFELVRTDISSFYESVDRKRLFKKLDEDQLLGPSSKKYVKQVLDSYGSVAAADKGVPRGVGISAYLAELYLRSVDNEIREIPGLVLYCRYVDDIVAVFARPPSGVALGSYEAIVTNIIKSHALSNNPRKTKSFVLNESDPAKFDYLGYRFVVAAGRCKISPSRAKIIKCGARLRSVFRAYEFDRSVDSRRAYRDLVARVKFLTGNTRLANSKSRAVTGIYYNNSLATDIELLKLLDKRLKQLIATVRRPKLRKRLKQYSFEEGFTQRRFHNFNAQELQIIVRAWKNG